MASTSNLPFAAALLAGGLSRRMGRDKATLSIGGEALWQRQIRTLTRTGAREVIISGRRSSPWTGAGYQVVEDELPGQGPLRALATLLRHVHSPWLLVLGVDLPAMTPDFLHELAAHSIREGAAVVPYDGERWQPLAACYHQHCLALIDAQLARGEFAIHRFLETANEARLLRPFFTSPDPQNLFQNLNTPADVERFSPPAAH